MSAVVVLGDVNVDIVARLESYPPPGGDAQPLETKLQIGGTSLNTAIMLQRLGVEVTLVARVGRDVLGDFAVREIERNGIGTDWVQRDESSGTGIAYVAITPDGERTLLGGGAANRNLDAHLVPFEFVANTRWLHVTSYSVLGARSLDATLRAAQAPARVARQNSMDIGMAPVRLAREAVMAAAQFMNVLMPSEQVDLARCERHAILRKRGARGCDVEVEDGRRLHVPAFNVVAVDSTGAGDAFNAGYIAGRLLELGMRQSVLLANACGAAAVTVLGAGSALPGRDLVARLLRERAPTGWEREARQVVETLPA
jgi:ribokinase